MDDDFIKNDKFEGKSSPFKINQLKLEHFYYNDGDLDVAMPISTSLEIVKKDDVWKKIIVHNYISPNDHKVIINNTYEKSLENYLFIVKNIEEIDLRELKNNYFSEKFPEKNSHWELSYNKLFKIIGTHDQLLKEYIKISELLDFDKVIKEEISKVKYNI